MVVAQTLDTINHDIYRIFVMKRRILILSHTHWPVFRAYRMVVAENDVFTLQRRVREVGGTHLDVFDSISVKTTAPVPQVAAVQVKHTAQFDQAGVEVTSAELPGALYPYACSTMENQDEVWHQKKKTRMGVGGGTITIYYYVPHHALAHVHHRYRTPALSPGGGGG